MRKPEAHDVIVVGGGPAGAVAAWALARRGIRVAVIERARFPREKVCGDFVEPGGLRILAAMDCLQPLESAAPLPITHALAFVQSQVAFRGAVPYYEGRADVPPHGYIVPRADLDLQLLNSSRAASAKVYEGCSANAVRREGDVVHVAARKGKATINLCAPLVIGADGTESIVARSFGQARHDPRYMSISQRGYVQGVAFERGEASVWFDEDLYPGYAWIFPMSGGTANVGIGVLAEASQRHGLSVPKLFTGFIEKLRRHHPACAQIKLIRRPLGGVVKSYAGVGRNYFAGGLLIGDAGSFVDPMTGEGITQGMESALLAATTAADALQHGRCDADFLSRYERDFRSYFDPAMRYLDLCASVMRNRHMSAFWLQSVARGCREAMADPSFARVAGASFGGLELRPLAVLNQVFGKVAHHIARGSAGLALGWLTGHVSRVDGPADNGLLNDVLAWQRGMLASFQHDPSWHMGWMGDVAQTAARLLLTSQAPRVAGVSAHVADRSTMLAAILQD